MKFSCEELENPERAYTVYDLTAYCYDYLLRTVDDQAQFLGKYIMYNDKASVVNPNLTKLNGFSSEVEKILRKREEEGLPFPKCMNQIEVHVRGMVLQEYENPLLNEATIPFYILLAIDRYVQEKWERCSDSVPLNKEYCKDSYIYLDRGDSMIDEAAQQNDFSNVILAPVIRNQFMHLVILEKEDISLPIEPPRVVKLWIEEEDVNRKKALAEKKLNIAVVPFSCDKMLEFPIDNGALFHVEYNEHHREMGINRALDLLESAINHKANIIIFPEFVCSQEIQDAIQERLKDIFWTTPERLSSLLFVVAGSAWTTDNNNVAVIFSYSGEVIGKQYKNSRYSDWKLEEKQMIENLQNPGKEMTIVEVEGLGKVLIGICRDVSDRSYTRDLARIFAPQLLITPAWSRSVYNGFMEQFREIVSENHKTCSILCNCCEAINSKDGFRKDIGLITTPYKEKTTIVGRAKMLCRKQEQCSEKCKDSGCIFLADVNFSPKLVGDGKMVRYRHFF